MNPKMVVVAGAPGSGKSSALPVASFGIACFNADDRAAELNGGSYQAIPQTIRSIANREFEAFILNCIDRRVSFACETTLRSSVTFDQAALARAAGFTTEMNYIGLKDFRTHVARVKARADAGGHSASETTLRSIYEASLRNLPRAVAEMDHVWAYDNSVTGAHVQVVLESTHGEIRYLADPAPSWLARALQLG